MPTYVMLTRLNPESVTKPKLVEDLEKSVTGRIRKSCPEVKWIGSYSILGPYDYLDIFEDVHRWTRPAAIATQTARQSTAASRQSRTKKWERHAAEVLGVDLSESDAEEDSSSAPQRAELASLLRDMQHN